MSEIGKTLSKFLFYAVAIVLLAWTASLTVAFITAALPNMAWYVPYLALVAFDGGMIAWLFVFLKYAQGTMQRAVSIALTAFDFLGVALLVIAEILLGGQNIAEAPAALGTWAIWGIGIWTVVNVAGVLLFHIGDPDAQVQMSIQNEKDAIFRGALANLGSRRVENSKALADTLGARMYDAMLAELFVDRNGDGIPDALQSGQAVPGHVIASQTQQPGRAMAATGANANRTTITPDGDYSLQILANGRWVTAIKYSHYDDAVKDANERYDEGETAVRIKNGNAIAYELGNDVNYSQRPSAPRPFGLEESGPRPLSSNTPEFPYR